MVFLLHGSIKSPYGSNSDSPFRNEESIEKLKKKNGHKIEALMTLTCNTTAVDLDGPREIQDRIQYYKSSLSGSSPTL